MNPAPLFPKLPDEFPNLSRTLESLGDAGLGNPPDMKSVGEQVYAALHDIPTGAFERVSARHWRNLPYAIWLGDGRGLANRKDVLDHYFGVQLPQASQDKRRLRRWLRPLLFIYVEHFDATSPPIQEMARMLSAYAESESASGHTALLRLHNELQLFNCTKGPGVLSAAILSTLHKTTNESWLARFQLWPSFFETRYAQAAYLDAIQEAYETLRTDGTIRSLMTWSMHDDRLRYPERKISLVEAILLPWQSAHPSAELQKDITNFVLQRIGLGDPRHPASQWQIVDPVARKVMLRWLAGRMLDIFFSVLKETADEIWTYRQKFWGALYRRDLIEEAWVVLGRDADEFFQRKYLGKIRQYGRLAGAQHNQSVLLMRIGDLVFAEWSHSGKLRAQHIDDPASPKLYRSSYRAEDLRFHSLPFGDQGEGLIHHSSANGTWQDRASIFIRQNLGVTLKQSEYR